MMTDPTVDPDDYLDYDGLRLTDAWGDSVELRLLDGRCVVISDSPTHLEPEQARVMSRALAAFADAHIGKEEEA